MPRIAIAFFAALSLAYGHGGQTQPKTWENLPPAAQRVLDGLRAGGAGRLKSLVEAEFDARAFERRSADQIVAAMTEAATAGGGLDLKQIWTAKPDEAVVVLATRRGVSDFRGLTAIRWIYFEAVLVPASERGAGKVMDFTLQGIPNPTAAEDPALSFPASVPPSERALTAEIRKRAGILADEDRFAGTILVAKGDRIVFQGAYGDAEKNHRSPVTLDSVFHMASATKMFTSVAIAQLVEAGKLRFDERLIDAWPDYPNRSSAEKITLAQLLSHTSGLGDGLIPEVQRAETRARTLAEAIPLSARQPLRFEPGSQWSYSNLGFMVLGRVVELASGLSYESYVEKNILRPAGMIRTGNYDLTTVIPGLAIGYGRQADDPLGIRERHAYWPLVLGFRGTSAGGYYSTAPDMWRFLRALRSGRLLAPQAADYITAGKRTLAPGRAYAFGFWDMTMNGRSVRGHGGGGAGYGINTEANTFWTPGGEADDFAVIILSNFDPPAGQDFSRALLEFLSRSK
jgi:CubicO group peptidase (beta-lactamase class C family)